ncbi:hypothetical protein F5884DRAFT_70269 [Xylogone sp. PMI_703]|nr:hypothetical protein F5884DRAFT_70269 [Xylogone sp. PMI_703]
MPGGPSSNNKQIPLQHTLLHPSIHPSSLSSSTLSRTRNSHRSIYSTLPVLLLILSNQLTRKTPASPALSRSPGLCFVQHIKALRSILCTVLNSILLQLWCPRPWLVLISPNTLARPDTCCFYCCCCCCCCCRCAACISQPPSRFRRLQTSGESFFSIPARRCFAPASCSPLRVEINPFVRWTRLGCQLLVISPTSPPALGQSNVELLNLVLLVRGQHLPPNQPCLPSLPVH